MQRTTVSRRLVPLLLVLAALVLIGDSIRLFLAPPGDQATIEADGVEAMLSISSKYILRARDCVAIEWAVTGADFVTLDGQRVPATGSGRYCPVQGLQDAPTQPLPEDYRPAPRTELGRDPSLTAHFNQQMELLNVRLPIYILLSDPLWGWRLVVAGLALLAAVRLRAGRPFEPRPTRVGANLVTVWLLTAVLVWVGLRLAQTWLGTSINPSGGLNLRLASTLLDILRYGAVMLVYAAALQLTGSALVGPLYRDDLPPFAALATGFLLGLGCYALVWMVLGLVGGLHPAAIWLSIGLGLAGGGLLSGRQVWADLAALAALLRRQPADSGWRIATVLALIWVAMLTLRAIAVPSIDGPITYMLMAKVYAVSGQIQPITDGSLYYYTLSGQIGELHMAALLAIGGEIPARLLSWFMLLNTLLMAGVLGRQLGLQRDGLAVMLFMLVTSSALTNLAGDGKTDLYGIALALGAIFWIVRSAGEARYLLVVGLLSGFATLAKITYGPALGIFIVVLTLARYWQEPRSLLRVWSIIGAAGLLPIAFHMVRNGLTLGEPFVPLFVSSDEILSYTSTFDIPWTDARIIRFFRTVYPAAATFPLFVLMYGTISPLWLGLMPALLWIPPRRSAMLWPAMAALVGTVAWVMLVPTVREVRYVLPLLIVLFVPVAGIFDRLSGRREPFAIVQTFTRLSVVLLLIAAVAQVSLSVVAERLSVSGPLLCSTAHCEAYRVITDEQPAPGTRVFSNDRTDYYLRHDMLLCNTRRSERQALLAADEQERWSLLYAMGFDYAIDYIPDDILRSKAVSQYYKKPVPLNPNAAPDWLHVEAIFRTDTREGGTVIVYRLQGEPEAPSDRIGCQQTQAGSWVLVDE